MPFTLTKQFSFEACHSLPHMPDGHKCKRFHGHSYRVEVVIQTDELDERGFAGVDYAELRVFSDYLQRHFDHWDLNVVMGGGENTTAERLAKHFFVWLKSVFPQLAAVRVSETQKTWAEYRE